MKKLDTSFIAINVDQYILKGTLDHIQQSYTELFDALGNFFRLDNYSPFTPYILWGCEYDISVPGQWTVNSGVIYYNHEFYLVAATTKSNIIGKVPVLTVTTTYASCDPTLFSDGSTHNVHDIVTLVVDNGTSGSGTADFTSCVRINSPQVGLKSGQSWGSQLVVNFERSQRLFYPTTLGSSQSILFDFTSPAIGCKKYLFGNIPASSTISISNTPAVIYIIQNGVIAFRDNYTTGGPHPGISFTAGGDFCLEIEYMGQISSTHQVRLTVIGS